MIVDGSSFLLSKAWTLSSASSPQAREMQPLMSSSQVQVRGVQEAWQLERHHRQSTSENEYRPNDTPFVPVPTVLSSNQSMPVAKESGANTQSWQTPVSIMSHTFSDWIA